MRLFGFAGHWPDSAAQSTQSCHAPQLETQAGVTVALEGGPVWLAGVEVAELPAAAILQAYRTKSRRCLDDLSGRFALAIIDRPSDRVLLAVDRAGIERLAYATFGQGIVFSSSVANVAGFAGLSAPLRPQALFDYLLLHMVPAPETVYAGVFKLRPGTCATFEQGRLTVERYWTPEFTQGRGESFATLREGLHASLRGAVEACRPDEQTGAFLSGGLDSSTVTGLLSRVTGRPPHTFSIGFGIDEYDELKYAHIASRHFGALPYEYYVTPDDVVEAFPKIAAAFDEPFGNSSAVPTYFCAQLAVQHGITQLLAGDGGDELFGGNERYARQRIFEAYSAVPATVRSQLIEPLVARIDPESRITPLRKLRSYVDQARIPMPERLESWNFIYRTDLAAMLDPGFRDSIDTRTPLRTMAEVFASGPGRTLLQRLLFYDWHYTLSDNDLRKVGAMCELAGSRVSYPMLDPRVVDVSLRVPPRMMMRGLELRSFYKHAMRGFLPDEILAKKKHGFGLPFGLWLKTHARLGELIYGLLSELKSRGIVKSRFLDTLIADHRLGHSGYYGYAIWDLAMLEAWLQQHAALTVRQPWACAAGSFAACANHT